MGWSWARYRAGLLLGGHALKVGRLPIVGLALTVLSLTLMVVVREEVLAPGCEVPSLTLPRGLLYVAPEANCGARRPCYRAIQDAVDAASDGDTIRIARGLYTGSGSEVVRIGKGVTLLGGYSSEDWTSSHPLTRPTVIDAEGVAGRRAVYIDGTGVSTITLSGLVVQRGYAQRADGGGVCVVMGTVTLRDNTILSNTAGICGGGVYVSNGTVTVSGNALRANSAQYGGGMCVDRGAVTLAGNAILVNEAHPLGGALAVNGGTVTGTNDVIAGNASAGTGVYLPGGSLKARHWTLVDNGQYGLVGKGGSAVVRNTIVASHDSGGLWGYYVTAFRVLFHDSAAPCGGGAICVTNLSGDPRFVSPATRDYHIAPGSAAVDQGRAVDVRLDVDGDPRAVGEAPDLGADELDTWAVFLPVVLQGRLGSWD